MQRLTTPIPQDKIGESFVWREWFQKLSNKVFGDLATQNSNNVNITGGTITGVNLGVTSVAAGTGINVSKPTGDIIISNGGVTSLTGSTRISTSSSTGSVTIDTVGYTGSFTTGTGTTVTVVKGIITSVA